MALAILRRSRRSKRMNAFQLFRRPRPRGVRLSKVDFGDLSPGAGSGVRDIKRDKIPKGRRLIGVVLYSKTAEN